MKHQTQIASAHLETIYLVQLKRISKGFSAKRLSFFIGRDHDYVQKVESFQLPVYSSEELERIALALEENNHKSFYAAVHDETVLNVVEETHSFKNNLVHSYFSIDENKEECMLFMLSEELFGGLEEEIKDNESLDIATDAIDILMRAGYLDEAKSGIDILHSINRFLDQPLNPFYIETAIGRFYDQGENEKELTIIENIIDGHYEYQAN